MAQMLLHHKKRIKFSIIREVKIIEDLIDHLPEDDEVYKLISFGGFSSIGFIKYIADRTVINHLHVSTLRVGKKHLKILDALHRTERLKECTFLVGTLMEKDSIRGKKYGYYDDLQGICDKNGWSVTPCKNHSKLLLLDTDIGKYVIETSSNLNENPKIEHFSFEKSEELHDLYVNLFEEVMNWQKENLKNG